MLTEQNSDRSAETWFWIIETNEGAGPLPGSFRARRIDAGEWQSFFALAGPFESRSAAADILAQVRARHPDAFIQRYALELGPEVLQ